MVARVFLKRVTLCGWKAYEGDRMHVRFGADVHRIRIFAEKQEFNIVKMGNQKFPLPYYLVDPKVFNPDNPASKGVIPLREGERVQIGRDHSHGFNLHPARSSLQFSILKMGDEFEIIDHNSTNGTRVMVAFKVSPDTFKVGMDISRIEGLEDDSPTRAVISRINGNDVYIELYRDYLEHPELLDYDNPAGYSTTIQKLMEKLSELQDQ